MHEKDSISPCKNVWILLEQKEGTLDEAAIEMLCLGRAVADKLEEKVCVLPIGDNPGQTVEAISEYGADRIVLFDSPQLEVYSPELLSESIAEHISAQNARIFISIASSISNDLFTRIAVRLKTGLAKNCVGLELDEENLLIQTKPVYGSKAYATIICPESRPQMATIKPGKFSGKQVSSSRGAEIITVDPQISFKKRITREGIFKADPDTIDIDEADIIVAGGGGVGSADNFRLLKELAECLGGTVAASLVPVDKGWINKNKTVGQTGKTVSPKLYIACGISGEHHHVLGMKDSENIVAINTNTYAPIFKIADIGIAGDVLNILPALILRLREYVNSKKQDNIGNSNGKV